jgi:protein BUR2
MAATSLFLATKTEENCRKTKEIVIAVAKVAQKNASLIIDEQSKEFWRWRDAMLHNEELLLEILTFDVVLKSPYERLYAILKGCGKDVMSRKNLRDAAWSFLNDSALTTLCLVQSAQDIAIAAIYWASEATRETIPDGDDGRPWYERYGAKQERVKQAVEIMFELYSENPLQKSDNPYDRSPTADVEFDKTRTRDSRTPDRTPAGSTNGHENRQDSERLSPKSIDAKSLDGSSDAKLKEAANDPATHAGTAVVVVSDDVNRNKRKETSSETVVGDESKGDAGQVKEEGRESKRLRREEEESEEGEVEE